MPRVIEYLLHGTLIVRRLEPMVWELSLWGI